MNKRQLIEKGFDVSHWPSSSEYTEVEDGIYGDVIGVVYDTTRWPVPDDTYHADNWPFWHSDDPNRPEPSEEEIAYSDRMEKGPPSVGGGARYYARLAHEQGFSQQ